MSPCLPSLVATLFAAMAIASWPAFAAPQTTYYLDPTAGNDTNRGTLDSPFRSIPQAQRTVRALAGTSTEDIVIYLRAGVYALSGTLEFGTADSGKNGHKVTYRAYPGEIPIISGGRVVTGWQRDNVAKNIYRASVAATDNFRQLYVNGARAIRARSVAGLPGSVTQAAYGYTTTDVGMASWRNPSDIEFVYNFNVPPGANSNSLWMLPRLKVASIVPTPGQPRATVKMQDQQWAVYYNFFLVLDRKQTPPAIVSQLAGPTYIENAFELLDQPGEWYLDGATHQLYYIPRPGEDLASASVVAPILEKLLEIRGTLLHPVQNLHFEGVLFAYATDMTASKNGHLDLQTNHTLSMPNPGDDPAYASYRNELDPANVRIEAAKGVAFSSCTFTHLGGAGVDLAYTKNCTLRGSTFADISGTAIQVLGSTREPSLDSPDKLTANNAIYNNIIHDVAVEYQGGAGIFIGYTDNTLVAHNELYNLPYTGISLGWGWGGSNYSYNGLSRNNKILYNKIHDYMKVLADGGAIYTLGDQPNTLIQGNFAYGQGGPVAPYYIDNGSAHITLLDNVAEGMPGVSYCLFANQGHHDNTIDKLYATPGCQLIYDWNSGNRYNTVSSDTCGANASSPCDATSAEASAIKKAAGVFPEYLPNQRTPASGWTFYNDNTTGEGYPDFNQFKYVGAWRNEFGSALYSGGTVRRSDVPGSSVTFRFHGTGIRWHAPMNPSGGIAAVSIDAGAPVLVSLYRPVTVQSAMVWQSPTLPSGEHTLTLSVAATPDARASGNNVLVDGVEVYDPVSNASIYFNDDVIGSPYNPSQIDYSGGWTTENRGVSRGTCRASKLPNESLSFRFVGTQIKWHAPKRPTCGMGAVTIDGGPAAQVDLYSPTVLPSQVVWSSPVLANGQHRLQIKSLATRNPASTDSWVLVDGLEVTNPGDRGTTTIEDDHVGPGPNHFSYFGKWSRERRCASGTITRSRTPGDRARLTFSGTQVVWHAAHAPDDGVGAVSIDGGPETMIDAYAAVFACGQPLWTSPVLPSGTHTLDIRVTGIKNPASSGYAVPISSVTAIP